MQMVQTKHKLSKVAKLKKNMAKGTGLGSASVNFKPLYSKVRKRLLYSALYSLKGVFKEDNSRRKTSHGYEGQESKGKAV